MEWVYLGALLFSIGGLLMLDHKFKLAFWKDTKRAALSLSTAIAIFIVWDFFGISLGIFFTEAARMPCRTALLQSFLLKKLYSCSCLRIVR